MEHPSSSQTGFIGGLKRTFSSSFSVQGYRWLWFGMLFSVAAMQINIVARSWLAYNISGDSALALGLVAMARGLPQLVLSPIAGVAADRLDKRKLLVFAQTGVGVLCFVNAVLVQLGVIQVWQLVVLGLFQGMIFPFTMPARQAYIPELVGKEGLPNALAMDSAGRNLNRVLAPTIGGILIAWNPTIAFYAVAVFYLCSALTLLRIPKPKPIVGEQGSVRQEMMIGFKYIMSRSTLYVLIIMGFLAVVLGMQYQQLLAVFQATVLKVGPTELGEMYTVVGVGAIFGSIIVAYYSDHPRKRLFLIIAGIAFGGLLIPFGLSTTLWFSLVMLGLVGLASEVFMTFNRMLVLLTTDARFYGRVMGIYVMTWSLMPVATLPTGALVDAVGAPLTVAVAGALLVVSIAVLAFFSRNPGHISADLAP